MTDDWGTRTSSFPTYDEATATTGQSVRVVMELVQHVRATTEASLQPVNPPQPTRLMAHALPHHASLAERSRGLSEIFVGMYLYFILLSSKVSRHSRKSLQWFRDLQERHRTGLPLSGVKTQISCPVSVKAVDGCPVSENPVTLITQPLLLTTHPHHTKHIQFLCPLTHPALNGARDTLAA